MKKRASRSAAGKTTSTKAPGKALQVTLDDIYAAAAELEKSIAPTPLLRSFWLSEHYECDLYLKLETAQPVGSFKIRGASYKISQLTPEEKKRGVIAASAGNHAQGVAWGARQYGVDALIVMPVWAPLMKIQNTQALGATVRLEGTNYTEAYEASLRIAAETGRIFVHAYEDEKVIAGQGTVGLEILDQCPGVDYVIGAMGGGGLMSGVSIAIKDLDPDVKIVGCQAKGASALVQTFKTGVETRLDRVQTFADGVAVSRSSERMYRLLAPRVDQVLTADDTEIAAAVLALMEKAKVVAEGAGALPLAALSRIRRQIKGRKVVVIISGGNIDVNVVGRIIDRGLLQAGRRLRLNVIIPDRPGSLSALADALADEGANILQAFHDRNDPSTAIDETQVELTLETRGPKHSERVLKLLKGLVNRMEVIH